MLALVDAFPLPHDDRAAAEAYSKTMERHLKCYDLRADRKALRQQMRSRRARTAERRPLPTMGHVMAHQARREPGEPTTIGSPCKEAIQEGSAR